MNTLYHLPFSANSRLVRVALSEKKIDVKLIVEPIWERRDSFLSLNPEGQVPVLLTNQNIPLSGAPVIIEWLEDISSERSLIGKDINFRAEARRIMFWFNNKFSSEVESSIVYEKIMKVFMGKGNPDANLLLNQNIILLASTLKIRSFPIRLLSDDISSNHSIITGAPDNGIF